MTGALVGAVEAGGTKFRCAVVSSDLTIGDSRYVLTADPDTTLAAVAEFFERSEPVAALGIASFGPVDLDPGSPGFGSITDTPKPGWSGAKIRSRLSEAIGVPAGIQTDVEAAAVAEQAREGAVVPQDAVVDHEVRRPGQGPGLQAQVTDQVAELGIAGDVVELRDPRLVARAGLGHPGRPHPPAGAVGRLPHDHLHRVAEAPFEQVRAQQSAEAGPDDPDSLRHATLRSTTVSAPL